MENIYPNNETGPWRQLWVAPSSLGPTPLTSWMRMICAQYIEVGPGGLGPGRIGGTRPTGFQNGEGYFGGLFPCLGLLAQLLFFFRNFLTL